MSDLKSVIRQVIQEEESDTIQGEEHDEEEDVEERVGVENVESGNYYKVRRSHALDNPQKYSRIREAVRKEIRSLLSERRNGQLLTFVFNGVEVVNGNLAVDFRGIDEASSASLSKEELEEAKLQAEQVLNSVRNVELEKLGGVSHVYVYIDPPNLTKKEIYKLNKTELNV